MYSLKSLCLQFIFVAVLLLHVAEGRNIQKRQIGDRAIIAQCGARTGLGSKAILAAAGQGVPGSCYKYTLMCLTYSRQYSQYKEECGVGLWWNIQRGTCEYPDSQARPDCAAAVCRPPFGTPPGQPFTNPDPRACYGVYECYPLESGAYLAHFEMCENSHFFDVTIGECRDTLPSICTRPMVAPMGTVCPIAQECTAPGLVWSSAYCRCVHPSLE